MVKKKSRLTVAVSKVKSRPVTYLMEPYLPEAKLTMFDGDPDSGKSTASMDIAAAISTGRELPGRKPGAKPRNVLVLNAEDDVGDTVKQRLNRQGANTSKVFVMEQHIRFDDAGLKRLEAAIQEHKPLLVIVDPLVAYMPPGVDMYRPNDVRSFMHLLAALAHHYRCAFLLIRHLTKGGKDRAIYRGLGSIDLTAACRSVLLMGVDPQDPDSRAIIHIKCNVAAKGPALGCRIEDGVLRFTGEIDMTEHDLLAASKREPNAQRNLAKRLLQKALADKPKSVAAIKNLADQQGVSERTLHRAKNELGIQSFRKGKKWFWRLP